MTTDRHSLPLPYSLASSRACQLSFVLVSSRMSLLVITSMILVFMAVFLMLAKLLTESIILFFLIDYFSVIYLLLSLELFSIGTLTRMFVYPGIINFRTNSLFQMGCVRVELTEFEKKGVGCYWNNHFVGALCYTDDIALLAPSAALRSMLDTCSSFASSRSLLFNVRPYLFVSHALVLHIVLLLVFSSMVQSSI